MSRGATLAARDIVSAAPVGGFVVPTPITDALAAHDRLASMVLPRADAFDVEEAAVELHAGGGLVELTERVARAEAEQRQADAAGALLTQGLVHAREVIRIALSDSYPAMIGALRKAHDRALTVARENAHALDGIQLNERTKSSAPPKVRTAWRALIDAGESYRVIMRTRATLDQITGRQPQHDTTRLYASLRRPLALFPDWRAPARVPAIPWPADDVELMVFLAGPAAIAEPWCPSIEEADREWLDGPLGEASRRLAGQYDSAMAMAGR